MQPSVHRVSTAISLGSARRGIGIHLSWTAPLPTSTNLRLLLVDCLDALRVGFALRGMKMDSPSPPFSSQLLCWPWTSIPMESFLGLGLFPQPWVTLSLGSSLKVFAFRLGLVPQSIAASSPSSLGSLVSWLWAIVPFNLGITQLDRPSSAKLLSGGTTTEY